MNWPLAMFIAISIDVLIGWPDGLFKRIGHPVTWIGALIHKMEGLFNIRPAEMIIGRISGIIIFIIVTFFVGLLACLIMVYLPNDIVGTIIVGILAWPLVAAKSMHQHGVAVAKPLMLDDLPKARSEVAMIVGRDPNQLDKAGVGRAAIESIAENTSDGIVAPVFWGAVLGLPGIVVYKAINTLDSMIGHKNSQYLYFGWASARLDDLVNLIPARITGFLFMLVSIKPILVLKCMMVNARHHRSPNAGWPESAMAGALGIRLSGPRKYNDKVVNEPWVNGELPDPKPVDLEHGLALYRRAILALWLILLVWAVSW